ncbi:MurR/RpiR family transcriptional regulator [Streptococcus caprae]|uniref:MurR/RpiR family transcriptional regulator n=1 Tax=Streptococcus caprae TaxID=1640501 RepID=A0ABV8CU60_9STRE
MAFLELINQHYQELSPQEKTIIAYLQNPDVVLTKLTSQGLADACFVSRSSVFRLLKKLDLDSFTELRILAQQAQKQAEEVRAKSTFAAVTQAYHTYIDQIFEKLDLGRIVDLLATTDVLYLYGTGNEQKLEVENFRQLFSSVGKRVIVFFDKGEYDYVKEGFGPNDLMILLSYKGEFEEGIAILKDSALRGIQRLVLTQTSRNTMAQLSDYQLYVPTESIQTPTRRTYEVSTTFYFIIDRLFVDYVERGGH